MAGGGGGKCSILFKKIIWCEAWLEIMHDYDYLIQSNITINMQSIFTISRFITNYTLKLNLLSLILQAGLQNPTMLLTLVLLQLKSIVSEASGSKINQKTR